MKIKRLLIVEFENLELEFEISSSSLKSDAEDVLMSSSEQISSNLHSNLSL